MADASQGSQAIRHQGCVWRTKGFPSRGVVHEELKSNANSLELAWPIRAIMVGVSLERYVVRRVAQDQKSDSGTCYSFWEQLGRCHVTLRKRARLVVTPHVIVNSPFSIYFLPSVS